ncbi:hypothetical protein Btru_038993 [Bulinus truncatus]|nr:hypothetical protein Btru_038993 [Bulinus truncatus]
MSSAQTWCLDRYARFMNRNTKEGIWKPYDNEKEMLVMTLTQQCQLMITRGSTLLESHNLMTAGSIMRGLSRTDSLLFLYKLKDETRRFKVKFSPSETKSGQEMCASAVQVLSEFIMIKTSITVNLPGDSNQEDRLNQVTGQNKASQDTLETSSIMQGEITVGTMAKDRREFLKYFRDNINFIDPVQCPDGIYLSSNYSDKPTASCPGGHGVTPQSVASALRCRI